MFDPRDPYERYYWHYDPKRPLSIAQIIASQSVDVETVALIWLLLEHGASLTVAGPTDPQPGVGKTTTVNALLQLLPRGSSLVYMAGMNEDFAFTSLPEIDPATTYVLCNEVSDHSPIYMWGEVAQRYLKLPAQGYHIVTSVHADTIKDVIRMYHYDLGLTVEEIQCLGIIINIGLVEGNRRWFTTHFLHPHTDSLRGEIIVPLPLSTWDNEESRFHHMNSDTLEEIAAWAGLDQQHLIEDITQRNAFLSELTQNGGFDMPRVREALHTYKGPVFDWKSSSSLDYR